jgi:threonine dehydratase
MIGTMTARDPHPDAQPEPAAVTLADVRAAAAAIAGAVVPTPTAVSRTLSEITGARVWLKFENLQFTASFKERGALNFLLALPAAVRARGVVAASAGNHAQGVAYHAHRLGIPATIVMPSDTPFTKVTRTAVHEAEVELAGDDFAGALTRAHEIAAASGATFVPAFDDPTVIAGQGTVALEILEAVPGAEVIVVPAGGGGLVSGVAVAAKALRPDIEIVGVQVEGFTGLAHALGRAPAPDPAPTIAEGIAVVEPGVLTRELAARLVDDFLVVDDRRIEEAVALAAEIEKTLVEGAGAAGLAALIEYPARFRDREVVVVLTGGNIDLRVLASVLMRALARSGRLVRLHIEVPDRPGVLAAVADVIGNCQGNIVDVTHRRDLPGVALKRARLELAIETRDRAHADAIVTALDQAGYPVVA